MSQIVNTCKSTQVWQIFHADDRLLCLQLLQRSVENFYKSRFALQCHRFSLAVISLQLRSYDMAYNLQYFKYSELYGFIQGELKNENRN